MDHYRAKLSRTGRQVTNQIFGENAQVGILDGVEFTEIQGQQIVASRVRAYR